MIIKDTVNRDQLSKLLKFIGEEDGCVLFATDQLADLGLNADQVKRALGFVVNPDVNNDNHLEVTDRCEIVKCKSIKVEGSDTFEVTLEVAPKILLKLTTTPGVKAVAERLCIDTPRVIYDDLLSILLDPFIHERD